jgi:predicted transposase YdaD
MVCSSGKPGDLALAVLASGGTERLAEIVRCAAQLNPVERNRALTQITLLCGLRRLSGKFRMEVRRMGMAIDLRENVILREFYEEALAKGRSEGRTEGLAEGSARVVRDLLQSKFGPLPTAVQQLLARASISDVERWATRILKADTLDAVFADE